MERLEIVESISVFAMKSVKKRAEAVTFAEKAVETINSLIPPVDVPEQIEDGNGNPDHLEGFNEILKRAAHPIKLRQT